MQLTDADVAAYTPLVERIANSTIRRGCPRTEYEDLVAVGLGALAVAANSYDPERGTEWVTWAYARVRGDMLHWWRDRCLLIRIPHTQIKAWEDLPRAMTLEEMPEAAVPGVDVTWLAVQMALERLSAHERELVVRHCYHGERLIDLAAEQGVHLMTIQRRVRRALDRLRCQLAA